MLFGEFFSCVWLVLLALNLMTTFPSCFYCSSYPTSTHLSSQSSSSSVSSSESEQNSATAAISANSLCHHSIETSDLISADCHQIQQKQQEPRMRITGEINEGPGPPSCPPPCLADEGRTKSTRSEKNSSCYRYLVQKDCVDSGPNDWSSIRLRHCCEHSVQEAVPNAATSLSDRNQCEQNIKHLLELDAFVAKVTCQFEQIILRFDCQQNYSVSSCQKCMDAYRRWVCASLIPHWRERHKIKPCRSICHSIEQNCPWFLPADKTPGYPAQYAGEPIFQCIDANIPETGEQLRRSTYGNDCCYDYCVQHDYNNEFFDGNHHSVISRIVSCVKGCNDSINNDPSQDIKSGLSVSCNNPSLTSSTSSTAASSSDKKNVDNLPFVNFPLSSCPSSESSFDSNDNGNSESKAGRSATTNEKLFLLIIWFMFCLFYTNMKLNYLR